MRLLDEKALLVAVCTVAILAVASQAVAVPELVRALLGGALGCALPGLVTVAALLPEGRLSLVEQAIATVGASLAITTCTAVLLAATPLGLTGQSLAWVLGTGTVGMCAYLGMPQTKHHVGRAKAIRRRSSQRVAGADSSAQEDGGSRRVMIVGADSHFLSAMTYYTIRIANAMTERFVVTVMPMRRLLPRFLYPGRARVGVLHPNLRYDPRVRVLPGVDWYWGPSLAKDMMRLRKSRPDVIVFQWWTATLLHTYLAIALLARLSGIPVILECHEVHDTSEARLAVARLWVRMLGRPLFRLATAFVIHSEADRQPLEDKYRLGDRPCVVIPHGPFDHHLSREAGPGDASTTATTTRPPDGSFNILFFGIIRRYKGLEDLVEAFDGLDDDEVKRFWLTVVGETWEGWDIPLQRIRESRHRDRITVMNRFVSDDEVSSYFAGADAVVLPYHRASASGPAHTAMSSGLPLVVTAVGGLPAAVADYGGGVVVPAHDPEALGDAIRRLPDLKGRPFADPHSWERTVSRYGDLFEYLAAVRGRA